MSGRGGANGRRGGEEIKMNGSLDIRPAVIGEYERLAVLWKGVEYLHHQGLPHIFRKPDDEWPTRSAVASLIVGPSSTILIAETNTEIAGFVALRVYRVEQTPRMQRRSFVIIENMAVDNLQRGRGVGRALLRAAEDWTAQRGIATLQLFVWQFNDAAVRFYESEGFVTELRGMARRSKDV
jgi:ribosomal protein S18 acetylase RimI-like enzyme